MEVLKVPMEKEEEKREELELCLELSIGGRYAKSENSMGKTENVSRDQNDNNNNFGAITRSDLSCDSVNDLQRRREIQALRRREARKKREEKLKKSRGQHGNFAFVEDRLFLEAQRIQARVLERDVRERDCCTEELTRKQDKINDCVNGVGNELHLCLYPKVQHPVSWGQNVALNCESEQCKGMNDGGSRKTVSFERSSSPVSEYQSTSQKGGNSSDAGSHSSPPCSRQYQSIPKREADHPVSNDSSSHIEPFTKNSNLNPHFNQTNNNTCPTSDNPTASAPSGVGPIEKPPKPPNHNNLNINAVTPVPHMPRVSATGNGPNGKTINGFLYKYTKTEVSIVCVCHGTSFSPAEFVEHAGGVDVSHPLRHITIIPSAFG